MIHELVLSLDGILRNPAMLAGQSASDIRETRIAAAAVVAALNAAESVPEAVIVEDCILGADEAVELYPVIDRRWLFRNAGKVPFVRKLSKKRLAISQRGLTRYLGISKS